MSKSFIETPENESPVFTIEKAFKIRRQVNADRPSHLRCKRWIKAMQQIAKNEISEKLNALKDSKKWEALRIMAMTAHDTTVVFSGCNERTFLLPQDYRRTLIKAVKWSLEPARDFKMKQSKVYTLMYSVKLDKVYINRGRKYTIRQFMPTLKDYRIEQCTADEQGRQIRMFGLKHDTEYSIQQLEIYLPKWMFETVTAETNTSFYPTLQNNVTPLKDWSDYTLVQVCEGGSKFVSIS